MQLEHSVIPIAGLSAPLRLFHITDMHLTEVSEEDSEYAKAHAIPRTRCFSLVQNMDTRTIFQELLEKSRQLNSDCVVMTGDIIDFPSKGNLACIKKSLSSLPSYFYTVGNHDWCYPIYDPPTTEIRARFLPMVEKATGFSSGFVSKQLGEVLLVGIDNGYYQITQQQYEQVETALKQGLPTLLFCHVPLYCPTLCPDTVKVWKAPILMGCPEIEYKGKSFGNNELPPQPITAAFLNLLQNAHNLVAIIAGHVHFSHNDLFAPGKPQLVTGCSAYNIGRIIDLVQG